MTTAPPRRAAGPRAYLILRVCETACALRVEDVAEVLERAALSTVAGAPSFVAGFLNLEGAALPVVELSRLLHGVSHEAAAGDVLVVLRNGEPPMALLATEAREIARAPANSLATLSNMSVAPSAIVVDDHLIPILSVDGLLLEGERRRIAELRAAEQRRLAELANSESAAV